MAAPDLSRAGAAGSLGDQLQSIIAQLPEDHLSLGELLQVFGDEGLLLLTILLTLVFLIPVSIPGVSTVFGAAILLVGVSRLFRRPLWLPGKLRQRPLPASRLRPALTGGLHWVRRLERISTPYRLRVLVDGLGSHSLPDDFWEPLVRAGGRAAVFAPVRFGPFMRRRDHVNFRNHRKIVVVDGKIGLTGGINIGREYLGLDPEVGDWRDTHVRIEGPAVLGMQQTFLEDWLHSTEELIDGERYFPELPAHAPPGEATTPVRALSVRETPSSVCSVSPSLAQRTRSSPPGIFATSKAWDGWPSSSIT